MDFKKYNVEKLSAQQQAHDDQQQTMNIMGDRLNDLGNVPSIGAIMLDQVDKKAYKPLEQKGPMDRQKELLAAYRQQKDAQKADREEADAERKAKLEAAYADPASKESQYLRDQFSGMFGKPVPAEMSGAQLKENFGKLSDYHMKKFGEEQERGTKMMLERERAGRVPKGYIRTVDPETGRETIVPENPQKAAFQHLPVENQEQVKDLAKKSASKRVVLNQINAALQQLEDKKLTEEQKLITGDQLVKTLNSPEGADAVGAEEVARLAPYLKAQGLSALWPGARGNVLTPDLPKFTDQVKRKSQELGTALDLNQKSIDDLYGRGGLKPGHVEDGHRFIGGNPADAKNWEPL